MEPLTAVGLAQNVIGFVSFVWGLIRGYVEIRKNGKVKEVKEFSDVTDSLRE